MIGVFFSHDRKVGGEEELVRRGGSSLKAQFPRMPGPERVWLVGPLSSFLYPLLSPK